MKKLLTLILIFSACGGTEVIEEPIGTTTSSTITTTTTSTTIFDNFDIVNGSDLVIGDCFDTGSDNSYYFSNEEEVFKLPCNREHSFEIITSINYQSTEKTEFNDDGVPNLEIYDKCVDSYFDTYGREIGGTSTFISWLGDVSDFTVEKEYKCFVGVFDYVNGPTYLTITYENYLNQKINTLTEKNLYSLSEGDCFWSRSPDVDFIYYQTVDVTSCSDVHSHEVKKIYEYPENLNEESEIEFFSFEVCESLQATYQVLALVLEEYEDLDVYVDYVFDDIAIELGDQNEVYCIAQLDYGETMWHKNNSLFSKFKTMFRDFENTFEDGSTVSLSCPSVESGNPLLFTLQIENRPIKSIELIYIENEVEYTADFTLGYQINDFINLSYIASAIENYYIIILSRGFNLMAIDSFLESFFEGTFYDTLKLKVVDNLGQTYEESC